MGPSKYNVEDEIKEVDRDSESKSKRNSSLTNEQQDIFDEEVQYDKDADITFSGGSNNCFTPTKKIHGN